MEAMNPTPAPKGDFALDLEKLYCIECGTPTPAFRKRFSIWVNNLGLHCVAVYRFARYARKVYLRNRAVGMPLMLLQALLIYFVRYHYHTDIFAADIGPGFYIGHVGSIYVGRCVIGSNLSLTHNVTIGFNNSEGLEGLPTVGSSVWIGTGSVVYGSISIGSGVTVNCGSILSKSIPDRCLVGGNPARVVQTNHENSKLFAGFAV